MVAEPSLKGFHMMLGDDRAIYRLALRLVLLVFDGFGAATTTASLNSRDLWIGSVPHG